ncbi:hypothetical protein GCM10011297_03840 [Bacterioplanes sanyensis]|uniref:hypothetical protein n=1 Tax=Bacterioplanes sanyensis TaxID=1249553 RepID=UPI00167739FA|nr:hypothetical protein [Bacterioplanes sanyensis]GGY34060.1 hypothetical protein GCM10011297_03840 [Bacterioplanes sanyensis]
MTAQQSEDHEQQHRPNAQVGSRIGRRLLSYILAFSFLVTLATTAFILFSDYKRGLSSYDQNIHQIRSSYLDSISYSLWNFDIPQLEAQLTGILNFPGVAYVFIESSDGTLFSAGDVMQGADIRHDIQVFFQSNEREFNLGTLHIDIDYTTLFSELKSKAINILVTQFIKTFSVSIFILFIVNRLLTRRLQRMSEWAGQFSLHQLEHPLDLSLIRGKADELNDVADAINQMRLKLQQDVIREQAATQELKNTKEKLAVAIDNAALGLCEYNTEQDQFDANSHFATHLGLTRLELEQIPHPMEMLLSLINGPDATEQQERLHQLLYGRIPRVFDTYQIFNKRDELCYVDMTFQITDYQENRPANILICMVNKTQQHIASQQAEELTINLENKVAKRTEELYDEQMRAKLSMQRLSQQLERCRTQLSNQRHNSLNRLLLQELTLHQQQHPTRLDIFQRYLHIIIDDHTQTMDLSLHLQRWLTTIPVKEKSADLPLSLVLEENAELFSFVLELLVPEENWPQLQQLMIKAGTDGRSGFIQVKQTLSNHRQEPYGFTLAQHIAENRLMGDLKCQWQQETPTAEKTTHTLIMDLQFSLSSR